jgi:hypothetical protein
VKRKTTPGQPNPGSPLSKNKASYKALVLTTPIAVVIPLTITPSLLLEGVFDGFLYLRPTPKIDFTRTVEHTPTTARELADLQFSLNTLSKHYRIQYRIHTNYKPRALYYRLIENLNLLKFKLCLSSVRTKVNLVRTVFYDRLPK